MSYKLTREQLEVWEPKIQLAAIADKILYLVIDLKLDKHEYSVVDKSGKTYRVEIYRGSDLDEAIKAFNSVS